jgi:hypothetical protein
MDSTNKLIEEDFWPASLAHIAEPYVAPSDEYVIVGEVSSEPANGYRGNRLIYTALVPRGQVDAALQAVGGIGQGVRAHGPRPCVGKEGGYDSSFWINGPDGPATRYEALVHTWRVHNRDVLIPDDGFLMCYGLTPRTLADGTLVWDDPSVPVYDVVRVKPESIYTTEEWHSTARVEILRDYLEDYLDLKGAVAVATQFEERWSSGDPLFESVVGSGPGAQVGLKGRTLWLKPAEGLPHGDQLSQVWCSRVVMVPQRRPISDPQEQSLKWPDHPAPLVGSGLLQGFGVMEEAYVRDEVLVRYENRPEFVVNPESGSVSYGGWWGVGYGRRVGRNHIALELRKLYEGAPFSVIEHYWKHAVSAESVADSGEKPAVNIGTRAARLVDAYLLLIRSLRLLCEAVGLSFSEEEIGSYSTADVTYQGWWRIGTLSRLGNVSLLTMPYSTFLSRCKDVHRLLEGIKPAPLRNLASALGIDRKIADSLGTLKLCAAVCQLATIAQTEGYGLTAETAQIAAKWDKDKRLPCFAPLFAIYSLRQADAHTSSATIPAGQIENLKAFSIDAARYHSGWGEALDLVYDSVANSLEEAAELIYSTRL